MVSLFKNLRRRADMATSRFDRIFETVDLPSLPEAAMRVSELCRSEDFEVDDVTTILETDAALGSAVLRLANSAAFGRRVEAVAIRDAVMGLGRKTLSDLALGWGAMGVVETPDAAIPFNIRSFWSDSLVRAIAARILAQHVDRMNAGVAFTGALLARVAIPTLLLHWHDCYLPTYESYIEEGGLLAHHEATSFDWTHAQAGAWIAKRWQLPDPLVCAIGMQHAPTEHFIEVGLQGTAIASVAAVFSAGSAEELEEMMSVFDWGFPGGVDALLESVNTEFVDVAHAFGISPAPPDLFAASFT